MAGEFRIGEWLIQPELNRIRGPDREVHLEPKVMDVLVYLAGHTGELLPKQRIMQALWPDAFVTDEVGLPAPPCRSAGAPPTASPLFPITGHLRKHVS